MTESVQPACPRCGEAANGKFCAACGSPLEPRACVSCGAALSPGARFCHRCGAAVGGSAASGPANAWAAGAISGTHRPDRVPWTIAAVLTIITIGTVVYYANKRSEPTIPSMANAGNSVTGVADDPTATPAVRAPDIANMTPKEQFTRLEGRITQALQKGDSTTVVTFTPMALGAYANLPAADRDIDTRYRAAMLEAQVGMFDNARALADTIMTESPGNLFGYYIRATVAEFAGDSAKAKSARAEFRAHFDSEIRKNRPEYAEHRPFLEQYRTGDGAH